MNYTIPSDVRNIMNLVSQLVGTDVHLIGGALRDAVLGGEPADYDIVFLGSRSDMYNFMWFLDLKLGFDLCHHAEYESTEAYIFDMRLGNINLIMYDSDILDSVDDLISKFDLNINQYKFELGSIVNHYFDGTKVEINPYRYALGHTNRLQKRISKFKAKYPHLDWSGVPSE